MFTRSFLARATLQDKTAEEINPVHRIKSKKFNDIPFKYHESVIIKIDDITNLGMGVGRYELPNGSRWVVMVPMVIVNEVVKVQIFKNYDSYSEADVVEIISPSPMRITPPCKYFAECGGCQYQHMNIIEQRRWKKSQVETALFRLAGISNVVVNDVCGTDQLYGYRSKLSPHYDVPLKYKSRNETVPIGFLRKGSRSVIDVDHCIITTPHINNEYALKRSELRERMINSPPKRGATLFFREHDNGVETEDRNIITQTVGNIQFQFKAGEFFQNNPYALPYLVNHVIEQAVMTDPNNNRTAPRYLIDAYCGSGLFALSAAHQFEFVYGVEISNLAVQAATFNAKNNQVKNIKFLCSSAEGIFQNVLEFVNGEDTIVVIDPPRKGCDEVFLQQLIQFSPQRIVYVSCDPATQARDTRYIIENGQYNVTNVTPFDLFPQTRHIENVMTFEKFKK